MRQRVLVIGGLGFIGTHLVELLDSSDYEVTIASRSSTASMRRGIAIVRFDLETMTDEALLELLSGFDSIVFAGGVDDRRLHRGDAYRFFYDGNVVPSVRLAVMSAKAGVGKLVILGSYFSHFDRINPEWKLSEIHPYIKSRHLQREKSIAAAGKQTKVSVLEIPYVFGSVPGLVPLWKPLVDYIGAWPVVFYTQGGTNIVAVEQVARAIMGILESPTHKDHWLVGGDNVTWVELVNMIAKSLGKKRYVISVPNFLVRICARIVKVNFAIRGIETGVDPYHFVKVQSSKTYLNVDEDMHFLHYEKADMQLAVDQTVAACQ